MLAGWQEVFVNAVHGQMQNLFLSLCQQLLAAAQVAAPAGLSGSGVGVGSARSTVESAAPFAAVQRRRTLSQSQAEGVEGGGGGGPEPPAALLLLLCKLCSFAEREAVGQALMLLQQLYPERLLSGGEELPAFLPSELGRQLAATSAALLQGYVDSHGCMLALAAATSTQAEDWMHAREPRAPREVCDLILEKVAGEWAGLGGWVGSDGAALGETSGLLGAMLSCPLHSRLAATFRPPGFLHQSLLLTTLGAEVGVEVAYLSDADSSSSAGGGGGSMHGGGGRLSRMHSRAHSGSSGASWESSLPAHSHSRNSSRAAGLDAQGAYMEASVSRMLSATQNRCTGCAVDVGAVLWGAGRALARCGCGSSSWLW